MESFILRDKSGKPRITLSAHDRLSSIIVEGEDGAAICLEAEGHSVRLRVLRAGERQCAVIAANDDAVSIVISDEEGKGRISLHCSLPSMSGELTVRDKQARVVRTTPFPP